MKPKDLLIPFCCFVFFAIVAPAPASDGGAHKIRYPVAAGTLYPRNGADLVKKATDLIDVADGRLRLPADEIPKAVIVPHGAQIFAGDVTAAGYAALRRLKPFVKRVVLIGSSHRGKYYGISLSDALYWEMPDRRFKVDREMNEKLLKIQGIDYDGAAHEAESSLESQLPFVSAVFSKDVEIVPVLVEDASIEQVVDLIDAVWGGLETVVVVSSDMASGKDADKVEKMVREAVRMAENKEYGRIKKRHFCASLPVAGMLAYAAENGSTVRLIDSLTTSGAGDVRTDKTLGYGAFGVYENDDGTREDLEHIEAVLREHQEALLRVAAQSIVSGFERGRPLRVSESRYPEEFARKTATFVNIYHNGALRGGAGSGEPSRSLLDDVSENAYNAVFSDFRFVPLTEDEIKTAELSISVLTDPVQIRFDDEDDLLTKLDPQQDGVIFRERSNKALFLPQIWGTFPSPKEFLAHLKQKAGLPANYWSPTVKIYRFRVVDLNSGDLENPMSVWLPKGKMK